MHLQAPFQLFLGSAWSVACQIIGTGTGDDSDSATCTVPRLMGFCKLHPGMQVSGKEVQQKPFQVMIIFGHVLGNF